MSEWVNNNRKRPNFSNVIIFTAVKLCFYSCLPAASLDWSGSHWDNLVDFPEFPPKMAKLCLKLKRPNGMEEGRKEGGNKRKDPQRKTSRGLRKGKREGGKEATRRRRRELIRWAGWRRRWAGGRRAASWLAWQAGSEQGTQAAGGEIMCDFMTDIPAATAALAPVQDDAATAAAGKVPLAPSSGLIARFFPFRSRNLGKLGRFFTMGQYGCAFARWWSVMRRCCCWQNDFSVEEGRRSWVLRRTSRPAVFGSGH